MRILMLLVVLVTFIASPALGYESESEGKTRRLYANGMVTDGVTETTFYHVSVYWSESTYTSPDYEPSTYTFFQVCTQVSTCMHAEGKCEEGPRTCEDLGEDAKLKVNRRQGTAVFDSGNGIHVEYQAESPDGRYRHRSHDISPYGCRSRWVTNEIYNNGETTMTYPGVHEELTGNGHLRRGKNHSDTFCPEPDNGGVVDGGKG